MSTVAQGITREPAGDCRAVERPAVPAVASCTLGGLFRRHRGPLLLTYGLFNLENLLRLAQPLVLGLAINDLLRSRSFGLLLFVGQQFAYLVVSWCRRLYDSRVFTSLYTDLATQLVLAQRGRAVEVTRVAARSAMSRALVEFFERDLALLVVACYSVVGSLVMLGLYDGVLVLLCLGLVVPAYLVNSAYGRKTLFLNGRLHDEFEREVEVIQGGKEEEVRGHYGAVARWRVKLADWGALNFGLMEGFVLAVLALTLLRSCRGGAASAGAIFAVFRYMMMYIMALDSVPRVVQQITRIRDVHRRIRGTR
jgi:hypothetical protein